MSAPVSVKPGDVIDDVYVIERLLGQGGMGAVFVAHEKRLARRVAIKVLLAEVAGNPEAVARFEREARSAAALQSDHVTRVHSVGHLASGAPYIVMELLDGEDLASLLAKRGALGPQEVAGFMIQVCEALTEAHALGIVHRDLKPANIFLARRPTGAVTVKVLDFGISKGATAAGLQSPLTKTTAIMGTPLYMSPEQLREARNVDGRADLWALGIMMYELLSGSPPFQSDALAELCVLILTTEAEPLIRRRYDVPPALDAIVGRCLKKDPAQRFANASELTAALAGISWSTSPPAPQAPAPLPPRMATPRMSPNQLAGLATAAIAERGRAQAPTQAQVQTPGPPQDPQLPQGPHTEPHPYAQTPPRAVYAGTVDPVSSTQPWLPARRPSLVGLAVVCVAAAAIGSVLFYMLLVKPAAPDAPAAAAASGVLADTSLGAGPSATASASSAPPATEPSSIATHAATAPAATALRITPLAAPSPLLPTPLPPPVGALPASAAPSARVVPAASTTTRPPTTPPPTNPGSLMPAVRN